MQHIPSKKSNKDAHIFDTTNKCHIKGALSKKISSYVYGYPYCLQVWRNNGEKLFLQYPLKSMDRDIDEWVEKSPNYLLAWCSKC